MDRFYIDEDYKLLDNDIFTFQVLKRVMLGDCKLKLTDHKDFILCYTTPPFPIWIWTADDISLNKKEEIWTILKQYNLLKVDINFNVKHEFADYLIDKAQKEKLKLKIITNMLAYECKNPIEPHVLAEGKIYRCSKANLEEYIQIKKAFHDAIKLDQKDDEGYRKDAILELETLPVFFWKNNDGLTVSSCNIVIDGNMACIHQVYTPLEHRRKHYAENVVYYAAKEAHKNGFIPTLYTNADYEASNKCYKRIGFEERGSLCTVGFDKIDC